MGGFGKKGVGRKFLTLLTCNSWSEIFRGIPQGSILGRPLFNIFISDILFFVEKSEICNFADGNTLYSYDRNLLHIKENVIFDMKNILGQIKR